MSSAEKRLTQICVDSNLSINCAKPNEPYHGPVPKGESAVATAVYKLGPSPPFLQHEACRGELHFDATSDLTCSKCGRLARDGAKLYVRGDFAICR